MKLVILGANGGTGRQLMEQALAQGHTITAFVRNPARVHQSHQNLRVVQGNILDDNAVMTAIEGQDAVLSALGVRLPVMLFLLITLLTQIAVHFARIRPPASYLISWGIPIVALLVLFRRNTTLSTGTRHVITAMQRHGVRRLICESSLGIGDTRWRLGFLYNVFLIPLFLRNVFADKEIQERIIRESGLDWGIVRPAALTNGQYTGHYRVGFDIGHWFFSSKISRADVADFMLKQVVSNEHLHKSPSIAN
jgi:putative NADH-flavin reductase